MSQTLYETPAAQFQIDLVEIVRLLWRNKLLIMLGCLAGGLLGVAITGWIAPRFQAEGNLVVRSAALVAPDANQAFDSTVVNEAVVTTEQDVLTSEGLLKRVAEQVVIPPELLPGDDWLQQARGWLIGSGLLSAGLQGALDSLIPPSVSSPALELERRFQFVKKAVTIVTTKGSSVIVVKAVTRDSVLSAAIVNGVMQLYMQDRANEESRAARVIENALREQLRQTRQQIAQGESQMAKMLRQPGTIENSEIPGQWQRMTLIGSELVKAQAELARRKSSYKSGMDVANLQATVDALQSQMNHERQQREQQSSSTIGLNGQKDAVASLWRVSDALEARLIDLAAHPGSLNARILSNASPPLKPSFPSKLIFAIAGSFLASVGTSIGLLSLAHVRRSRPMAIQLAQSMNAPLLAGVPQVSGSRSLRRKALSLIIDGTKSNGFAESLYAVALELEDAVNEGNLRCVTVTSAHSGEGKTTVATVLGRSIASMSLRVLLIDLDLRRPGAERMIMASDPASFESHVQPIGSQNVEVRVDRRSGLHVVTPFPAGCREPLAYLRSSSLRNTVEAARNCYDLIIFDTPPIMAVPDALVIARVSDATVLVAELGRNKGAEAAEMSRLLARTQRPVCGVVVTKVPSDMLSYSGYGLAPQ